MKEYDETKYKLVPIEEDDMNDTVDSKPDKKDKKLWIFIVELLLLIGATLLVLLGLRLLLEQVNSFLTFMLSYRPY
jgi:uncharacterized membrane protein